MKQKGKHETRQVILRLLFFLYCGLMIWLLFGQRMGGNMTAAENINLEPLRTLKNYVRIIRYTENAGLLRHAFINLAGNVVMFIPLGYLLPAIWKSQRKFFLCLITALLWIMIIETVQYITKLGSCDVDDLLLNLPGVILGWLIHRLLR